MKIDHFDLFIDTPQSQQETNCSGSSRAFIGGDTIKVINGRLKSNVDRFKGKVEINVVRRVQIGRLTVRIEGRAHTSWRSGKDFLATQFESEELLLHETVDLTQPVAELCADDFCLEDGRHEVPFAITVRFSSKLYVLPDVSVASRCDLVH